MYEFSNYHYERSHGKAPRGRGCWAFENRDGSKLWWVDGYLTLAEAKKAVTEQLKAEGVSGNTTIYVAP